VFVEQGATFVLGSDKPGNTGTSLRRGARNQRDVGADHFATINGGIDIHGGSGPFGGPFDVTWNAIEDNHINGGATVEDYNGLWFGFIRNDVNGAVNLNDNVLVDPDANEYVTNTIHGNLNCRPGAAGGRLGGQPEPGHGRKDGAVLRALRSCLRTWR
jgi:hypothetical protein